MDLWDCLDYMKCEKDRSFLKQTLGQPFTKTYDPLMEDLFPKEITDTSRAVLREQFERLSLERDVTMPISTNIRCDFNATDEDIRYRLGDLLCMPKIQFTTADICHDVRDDTFTLTVTGYYGPGASIRCSESGMYPLKIKNVIFNYPATIVYWEDGTKTVVKCENEEFDKEKGLAMAFMKKMLGNKGRYFNEVKKWTRQ